MILDRKYKCPVCSEEYITFKDKLQIINKGNINCSNCNARLGFAPMSHIITIPIALFLFASVFLAPDEAKFNIVCITLAIHMLYQIFFVDLKNYPVLEEYKEVKPEYNLNKFLDGLRNETSKK